MKNFKIGFTLAEVLVTLAIIGVVSSLTLPALSVNILKNQAPAALAKAINTLEEANALALHEMNCRELLCGNPKKTVNNNVVDKTYFEVMSPYIMWRKLSASKYQTKDGIILEGNGKFADITGGQGTNKPYVYGEACTIAVDINGTKGPNIDGKDIFYLHVDRKGSVFAEGSDFLKEINSNQTSWRSGNCDGVSVNTPFTCAGSIIDNGYKVIYNFYKIN